MLEKDNKVSTPRVHLGHLDGLRALASLYVVLFHALIYAEPHGRGLLGTQKTFASLFTFGHQAVDLFIVLSGFCLMLPVLKRDGFLPNGIATFFRKRAWRILPPYYAAMGLSLLAIYTLIGNKTGSVWDAFQTVTPFGIVAHLLMFQDVLPSTVDQINGPFWSISVEWRIYLVFPVLLFLWRKLGAAVTTLLAAALSCAFLFLLIRSPLHYDPDTITGIMPQYLALFTSGMLAAAFCHPARSKLPELPQLLWTLVMCGSAALTFFLVKAKVWHGSHLPYAYSDYVAGIAASSLLVATSQGGNILLRRFLSWRPLVFVGSFAYSLYLIHCPLQQVIWQYVFHPLNLGAFTMFAVMSLVGTPLIVGSAYLFHLAFERPFMNTRPGTKIKTERQAEIAAIESPAP